MDQIRDKSGKFSKANNSKTQSKRGDYFSKFNKRAKTTFEDHSYFRSESETESRDGDLDFEGGGNEIDIGCNVDLPLFGDDNDDFWRCGRRVVELELLAKNRNGVIRHSTFPILSARDALVLVCICLRGFLMPHLVAVFLFGEFRPLS